ncbi:hypothetical protein [Frankia sp. Cr1]|uniref:hypothetical protein n=1 Tax=Frankia sp. Cr1 TaxID=3073931 RepID=UPI002AD46644|nr:hypothetical protein [Frankia sp. Cr1]
MTAPSPRNGDGVSRTPATDDSGPRSTGRRDVSRQVESERVETVEMTAEEYDAAVSALAELVLQWERKGAPNTVPKKAA